MRCRVVWPRLLIAFPTFFLVSLLSPSSGRGQVSPGSGRSQVSPGTGRSQEAPVLSLDQALERAIENNPQYLQALNDLELNEVDRLVVLGEYLPRLQFSTGTGVSFNRQLIATDEFGNPVENPITEWRTSSSTSQSLSGSVQVWDWGARGRSRATQQATARSREAGVTAQLRTLRASVEGAYRNAQYQGALLVLERQLLAGRELDLQTTQRRFELAGASRVDVLTAQLNVRQQEQRIREAEGQLERALLSLRTVIGDPDLVIGGVEETLPQPFDPRTLDSRDVVETGLSSSPRLIEQEASLAVTRAQAESSRRSHWPGLTISFSGSQSTFGDQLTGMVDPFPDRSRSSGASFGLSIPIFQGFTNKQRIVQAEVSLANAEETLKGVRLQVEELVNSRFIALQTAYQSYEISLNSREIAQERLRLAQEQYLRLGTRSFVELQQDIDAAAQAERGVINQLFSLVQARVDLEETVGQTLLPGGTDGPEE